jgi:hypothetical protein
LPEEMLNLSDPPTRSTITAYVKKGERKDVFRGYNNFVEDQLYKFVDLPFLEGVYNSVHPSFRHVYLDRADEKYTYINVGILNLSHFQIQSNSIKNRLKKKLNTSKRKDKISHFMVELLHLLQLPCLLFFDYKQII